MYFITLQRSSDRFGDAWCWVVGVLPQAAVEESSRFGVFVRFVRHLIPELLVRKSQSSRPLLLAILFAPRSAADDHYL
jgi:hypothetical protein